VPIEQITTEKDFAALEGEWNDLLERSAASSIFLTWEWLSAWWASYGTGRQLLVLVFRDSLGVSQGIAPFFIEPYNQFGRTLRRLRFLGDGTFDSDYLNFIIARGRESELMPIFFDRIRALSTRFDVIQLNEIPSSSPTIAAFLEWHQGSGWLELREEIPCAITSLTKTWDEYLATLRPRFRTMVRACLRKLDQPNSAVEYLADEAQIEPWLKQLFSLHASRWGLRQQEGVFVNAAKRDFYVRMACAFWKRGWLHIVRWRLRDAVLACQFGLVYQNVYYLLQEGFDAHCSHISPGLTLRATKIRDLIAKGVVAYDFLGGIGRHKMDWGATEKKCVRLALAPPTLAGLSYVRVPVEVQRVKEVAKRLLPETLLKRWRELRRVKGRSASPQSSSPSTNEAEAGVGWREQVVTGLYKTGLLRAARLLSQRYELRTGSAAGRVRWKKASNPKFLVLCYHRVGTGGIPLYTSMDPGLFEAQMRFLRGQYRVVSLDTIYRELLSGESKGPGVAVTFDDGYRDLFTNAFPMLQKYEIPATIFVIAGAVETGQVAWYDRVFLALKAAPDEKLDLILDRPRRFLLSSTSSRLQAAREIISLLRKLPDARRKECCIELEKQVTLPEDQLANRMLTWEQIRLMHQAGIAIGSHTMTHPVVSQLSYDDLTRELSESKRMLEGKIEGPVQDFAFPFGHPADCGDAAAGVLAGCGYRSAATTVLGVNISGIDPYRLRRCQIGEGQSLPMFSFQMSRLFLQVEEENRAVHLAPAFPAEELSAVSSSARFVGKE
jgi:peptidoglycan/xylan/chitin deacetylase (PgdA/CDA1 family)/CelD/BcsL family acetyltransferase involved in cellulose biosynthesis